MINEALIWDKFYRDIIPSQCWNYKLQYEWAKDATAFYIAFNELSVIDIDSIVEPYVFTKADVANELEELISEQNHNLFEISTNCNGGMYAVYIGPNISLILTIEVLKDYTMIIEYTTPTHSGKLTYFHTSTFPEKALAVENLFRRLNVYTS